MRKLDKKAKREISGLCLLILVLVTPLFIWVRLRNDADKNASPFAPDDRKSPWRINQNSWVLPRIALSPDGLFLAGLCPTPASGKTSARTEMEPSDLVIWRVGDREEVSRVTVDPESAGKILWAPSGRFVATVGRFSQIFHWKSKSLVTAPIAKTLSNSMGNTDLDVGSTWLDLGADLKLQSHFDRKMQAFRISSGAAVPITWRSRDDIYKMDPAWSLALEPSKPGGPLKAVVIEETFGRVPSKPVPTPTPAPTPTPSPQQDAFLKKEKEKSEELSNIVNKLMGDESLSDEEKSRLEAQANTINAVLKAERARLFSPTPAPTPQPYIVEIRWARVSYWDLGRNRVFWRRRFRQGWHGPRALWSLDGKIVAIYGTIPTSAVSKKFIKQGQSIEFIDGATGKQLARTQVERLDRSSNLGAAFWLPGPVLAVQDHDAKQRPILRFIDPKNGATVKCWPLHQFINKEGVVTADANGSTWAFASSSADFGPAGWRVFSQSEIEVALKNHTISTKN